MSRNVKMNSRTHLQPFLNNSMAVRQEIQRFESVHPSIYAIYDLIDLIPDGIVAQQIRDHVVCIEGKFFNICFTSIFTFCLGMFIIKISTLFNCFIQ